MGFKVGDICKSVRGKHAFDPCIVRVCQNMAKGNGIFAELIKNPGPKWVYEESQLELATPDVLKPKKKKVVAKKKKTKKK